MQRHNQYDISESQIGADMDYYRSRKWDTPLCDSEFQVIGCGASTALSAQMEYRRLTVEDARRLKDKKLHADEWGVDTKILDWGKTFETLCVALINHYFVS